jgi:nitronate monooxygenase
VRNDFFAQWDGREGDLEAALPTEQPAYERAVATGDVATAMILAGEAVDLIGAVAPAAELVRQIGAEAEAQLRAGTAMLA